MGEENNNNNNNNNNAVVFVKTTTTKKKKKKKKLIVDETELRMGKKRPFTSGKIIGNLKRTDPIDTENVRQSDGMEADERYRSTVSIQTVRVRDV